MPCLFVDKLTVIDCSVLDPQRGLIGASWDVNVELYGDLDEQSMVFDFSHVKKTIKSIIDSEVDHKLVVPQHYAGTTIGDKAIGDKTVRDKAISNTIATDSNSATNVAEDNLVIQFETQQGKRLKHESPASAVCLLPEIQATSTAISDHLEQLILPQLPSNVAKLNIKLFEEQSPGHYYCYSHGLKKHDGNCQRIAHGHRSRIEVWRNEQRSESDETLIAKSWRDIYIGSKADIISKNETQIEFAYQTPQGQFKLNLPCDTVDIIDSDSTVECLAQTIANRLLADNPQDHFKVKAYEGIGKGAIAESKTS